MRRGFSLLESVAVLVLALTLVVAGAIGWNAIQGGGADTLAGNRLRGVAGEQQLLELSRGNFTTNTTTLTGLMPGLAFVEVATTPNQVSVSVSDGRLGLATMSESGKCLTLAVGDKDSTSDESRGKFAPSPGTPCSGASALAVAEGVDQW